MLHKAKQESKIQELRESDNFVSACMLGDRASVIKMLQDPKRREALLSYGNCSAFLEAGEYGQLEIQKLLFAHATPETQFLMIEFTCYRGLKKVTQYGHYDSVLLLLEMAKKVGLLEEIVAYNKFKALRYVFATNQVNIITQTSIAALILAHTEVDMRSHAIAAVVQDKSISKRNKNIILNYNKENSAFRQLVDNMGHSLRYNESLARVNAEIDLDDNVQPSIIHFSSSSSVCAAIDIEDNTQPSVSHFSSSSSLSNGENYTESSTLKIDISFLQSQLLSDRHVVMLEWEQSSPKNSINSQSQSIL
jgi:hypothetical protein